MKDRAKQFRATAISANSSSLPAQKKKKTLHDSAASFIANFFGGLEKKSRSKINQFWSHFHQQQKIQYKKNEKAKNSTHCVTLFMDVLTFKMHSSGQAAGSAEKGVSETEGVHNVTEAPYSLMMDGGCDVNGSIWVAFSCMIAALVA